MGPRFSYHSVLLIAAFWRESEPGCRILTNSAKLFAERCIDGLVANEERLRELAESSPSIVTPLNSAIGYEEAAAVAKEALKQKKTIRQTVIDRGLIGDKLSLEELDRRLDVLAMAKVKPGDS